MFKNKMIRFIASKRHFSQKKGETSKKAIEFEQLRHRPIDISVRRHYRITDCDFRHDIHLSDLDYIKPRGPKNYLKKCLSFDNASDKELNKHYYKQVTKHFGLSPNDTASYAVQAICLTHKINRLREHIASNKKDSKAKMNIIKHFDYRHKLMKILRKEDFARFKRVLVFCNLPDMWNESVSMVHSHAHKPSKKPVPPKYKLF